MGSPRSNKRDIERARVEKATAKRERRQARAQIDAAASTEISGADESQEEVLVALAALHERFAQGALPFPEFEASKDDLFRRLHVQ
jgi:hypothetical protein